MERYIHIFFAFLVRRVLIHIHAVVFIVRLLWLMANLEGQNGALDDAIGYTQKCLEILQTPVYL